MEQGEQIPPEEQVLLLREPVMLSSCRSNSELVHSRTELGHSRNALADSNRRAWHNNRDRVAAGNQTILLPQNRQSWHIRLMKALTRAASSCDSPQ